MRRLLFPLLLLALPATAEIDLAAKLPADPAVRRGALPNGLRYWIRVNKTPPGKASLLLHIGSGSLNEADDQRGVAHFLEHMAFNGSKHFPPGELVKYFESLGMQFGMHQNAFTSFNQTTYMMSVPDTKPATLDRVFLYFGDVAHRLTLADAEIDKERGVILEEKRSRSGAGQRMIEQILPLIAPGSRLAQRIPIGLEEVIQSAPRERFVDYYRTYYRPDDSVLIAVGDFDPEDIRARAAKAFAEWKAPDTPVTDADAGIPYEKGLRAAVVTDPDVTVAQVGWGRLEPRRSLQTIGDYRRALVEGLGTWAVNRRMRELVQKGEAVFQRGGVSTGNLFGYARSVDVDGRGKPEDCLAILRAVLLEAKRAVVHGFTDAEIDDAKRALLSDVRQEARTEGTRDSFGVARGLNNLIEEGRVPMAAAQEAELLGEILPTISRQEVEEAFRAAFVFDRGLVLATFPEKEGLTPPTKEQLLAVVADVKKEGVAERAAEKRAEGLLEKDPQPGTVAQRSEDKDLGIVSATLGNGVRVHVREMDYQKGVVLARVTLVGGTIEETAATKGFSTVAALGLTPGQAATARHSATDLTNLLTGKQISLGASAGDAYLTLSLRASPDEIEEAFRLLHLMLTQGRVDKTALERWQKQMALQLPQMETSVQARAQFAWRDLLNGDDVRTRIPTLDEVQRQTVAEGQKWLDRIVASAPMEVAIVGDLPNDKALALAQRYLGSLPARPRTHPDIAELRKLSLPEGAQVRTVEVKTITPQAMVVLGWRGAPLGAREDQRKLYFVSQILTARLNEVIREEHQLTYSIGAGAIPSIAYDGNGALLSQFTADPKKAADAAKLARATMEELIGDKPPTDDEMKAVRKQLVNIVETQTKEPAFWVNTLSTLETRDRDLDSLKNLEEIFNAYKANDLVECAKRFMTPDRYLQVIARPAKGE
jgi:zinc protease